MIELKNLTKRYGNLVAVNRLNLSIARGEIFGFIGPNGAGKTTTLRMMGGILAPTEGSVIIDGIDMAVEPEKVKKSIGFIPDRPFVYEKLTGKEFLKFTANLFGVKDGLFEEKADRMLKQFALDDWADELIEAYSHGMKQRLIMSAAILHDPEVIIVDEPMVGLDPAGVRMIKGLFRDLAKEGTTLFMSTHTLALAEDVCDRIGIIHKGVLIATGTVEELRRRAQVRRSSRESLPHSDGGGRTGPMSEVLTLLQPRLWAVKNGRVSGRAKGRRLRFFVFWTLGLGIWAGAFLIIYRVLIYFQGVEEFGNILAYKLLSMALVVFFSLLLFSGILTSLSKLYLSKDLPLVHAMPVPSEKIFLARWMEGTLDSSWMVLVYSLPIFISYGIVFKAGASYYAMLVALLSPFA